MKSITIDHWKKKLMGLSNVALCVVCSFSGGVMVSDTDASITI